MSCALMITPFITLLAVINQASASVGINERVSPHHDTFAGERGSSNSVIGGNGASSSLHYTTDSVYRNLDTQLLRIGSKLDQLMFRMDHLDSRVGRVQSTGHLRFDSIETSMQTTRQRLDLWSNQLNLIEEQLSRKWKNMENRFDSLVSTIDSKLDTKFNMIQRDNRRHNEFLSQSFNSVVISQEKLTDRVTNSVNEMNVTISSTASRINDSTTQSRSHSSMCATRLESLVQNLTSSLQYNPNYYHEPPHASAAVPHHQQHHHQTYPRRTSTLHQPDQQPYARPYVYSSNSGSSIYPHTTHQQPPSTSMVPHQNSTHLISTKVSNMFDELVKRSLDLEAIVKDTFTMSNMTRREIQDGFMALIPIVSQVSLSNNNEKPGSSSGEVMSMVVEALSSVEQMSTSLGRRMTEMSRSINERFEVVSMTLNGFLESCLRIQERAPQLEEKIGDVLWRILDSVDNSTRNATETWQKVKSALQFTNSTRNCTNTIVTLSNVNATTTSSSTSTPPPPPQHQPSNNNPPHQHHEHTSTTTLLHHQQHQNTNHLHHHDPYGIITTSNLHDQQQQQHPDLETTPQHNSRLTEQEHQIWNTLASGGRLPEEEEDVEENEHVPE